MDKYKIAVVVVGEVEAVDQIDASHIVEKAVRDRLVHQGTSLVVETRAVMETSWDVEVKSVLHLSAALQHGEIRLDVP